jgi:hypothetical protein
MSDVERQSGENKREGLTKYNAKGPSSKGDVVFDKGLPVVFEGLF